MPPLYFEAFTINRFNNIFYPKTIPAQPVMQELGYSELAYPISVESAKNSLALPIFPELTDDEQKEVVQALKEIL